MFHKMLANVLNRMHKIKISYHPGREKEREREKERKEGKVKILSVT